MTKDQDNPAVAAARDGVRRLRDAFPAHRWTDGVMREWGAALSSIGDPALIDEAVTTMIRETDDRYPPPIARAVSVAKQHQAAAKARDAAAAAGDRHRLTGEMPVTNPEQRCSCGAKLIYLTGERMLWCNPCRAVQVMSEEDGKVRVRLTDSEFHDLRFGPAKHLVAWMWPDEDDLPDVPEQRRHLTLAPRPMEAST